MNSIFHHVSIRKYKNQPVEKEKILRILKAGMQTQVHEISNHGNFL